MSRRKAQQDDKEREGDRPPSLAMAAYRQLYRDITNGTLAPGRKLPVGELHATYGIGFSPMRDALNRLCAEGLVEKREQRGFFVADLNEDVFLQITNARLVLEETALRLSIAAGDVAWGESVILAFYHLSRAARDETSFVLTPEWSAAHREFHFALLAGCGNEWLLGFCRKLYEQSERYRARRRLLSTGLSPGTRSHLQVHEAIMKAALAHDADTASDLLVRHYKESFEIVMNADFELLDNPRRLVPRAASEPEGRRDAV
ncbi:FCD domain-containing protein [Ancylobacter sp. MQZ15Z-1]|uniref:FCD domain-containing protein n=1 Tax=Ancylobacter mangrovi TaxID=2972472 RepID=A0A9X2PH95_9HYPH|nr:FCD domain-containing protein [Ancylobacter mangrovi]MCS0496050.1 FCD domain-containing protein [Ancylobacter mangrovi]